jgi:hypothetical protein
MSPGRISRSYEFALTVTQPLARVSDRLPEGVRGWLGERGEQTEAAAASHSGGKGGNAHPLHAPLHDGMLDAEGASQLGGDGHGEGRSGGITMIGDADYGDSIMRERVEAR